MAWNDQNEPLLVSLGGFGGMCCGQQTSTQFSRNLPDEWYWGIPAEPVGSWSDAAEPAGSWSNASEPAGSWSDLAEPAGSWTPLPEPP